ncbi:hypothetical protein [Methylotenera sp. 1P/1]|jgi:hypothetical protein|uniref:hypothetical protein n=1 Tax=Methylotenera sp. 1P/1 TaxID=1131551 RepID=UPI000363257A|nr:hypothetical protein [Methylotenera sp. 1P/1]
MDILNSEWLIAMLKKSGSTPHSRLLHLFDLLDDWLDAPKMQPRVDFKPSQGDSPLVHYLTLEAAKAGAAMPELLANQLYFMAIAAAQEKLHHQNPASLSHAKNAAKALIAAQTKREFHVPKKPAYAVAASTILIISSMIGYQFWKYNAIDPVAHTAQFASDTMPNMGPATGMVADASHLTASPEQTAALFARIEQMRKGNCQLIEALQLPDSYKKVYFENIILGQISVNREDQRLTNQLLDMVRCNYTPMLMANSKN